MQTIKIGKPGSEQEAKVGDMVDVHFPQLDETIIVTCLEIADILDGLYKDGHKLGEGIVLLLRKGFVHGKEDINRLKQLSAVMNYKLAGAQQRNPSGGRMRPVDIEDFKLVGENDYLFSCFASSSDICATLSEVNRLRY